MTKFLQCGKFSEFLELNKYESSCIIYRLSCFDRLLFYLHMFAYLMILFEDRNIKYAEEFSLHHPDALHDEEGVVHPRG